MDVRTAKKLKDKGFMCIDWIKDPFDEIVPNPTLEELIEACGYKFGLLERRSKDEWIAHSYPYFNEDNKFLAPKCATALEAVAMLYLALHEGKVI